MVKTLSPITLQFDVAYPQSLQHLLYEYVARVPVVEWELNG